MGQLRMSEAGMIASPRQDAPTASAGHAPATSPDSARALDAVRRLAGALSAEVLSYDRLAETMHSLVAAGRPVDPTSPALIEAAQVQTGLILGDPHPRWIVVDDAQALLLMKLADRGPRTLFIALAFADASSIVRARVNKLAPDLATLIRFHLDLGARLAELEEVGAAATAALDHGECGVIAIREDRSVIFRNDAAAAYMETGLGLQVRRGRVGAVDGRKFEAALHGILDAQQNQPSARPPAAVLLLKRGGGARPVVAVIAPARSASPVPARPTGAAALIYLFDPSRGGLRGMETLCHLHGLSGVESRLLVNLASGMTLSDAAAQMRIKLETARTYLKQIFAKTGVHRQTELMTMMSRYLRAFRGNFDFQPA